MRHSGRQQRFSSAAVESCSDELPRTAVGRVRALAIKWHLPEPCRLKTRNWRLAAPWLDGLGRSRLTVAKAWLFVVQAGGWVAPALVAAEGAEAPVAAADRREKHGRQDAVGGVQNFATAPMSQVALRDTSA